MYVQAARAELGWAGWRAGLWVQLLLQKAHLKSVRPPKALVLSSRLAFSERLDAGRRQAVERWIGLAMFEVGVVQSINQPITSEKSAAAAALFLSSTEVVMADKLGIGENGSSACKSKWRGRRCEMESEGERPSADDGVVGGQQPKSRRHTLFLLSFLEFSQRTLDEERKTDCQPGKECATGFVGWFSLRAAVNGRRRRRTVVVAVVVVAACCTWTRTSNFLVKGPPPFLAALRLKQDAPPPLCRRSLTSASNIVWQASLSLLLGVPTYTQGTKWSCTSVCVFVCVRPGQSREQATTT